MLNSILVHKDFLTWLLIGWQLCCQTIRCQVWKSLLLTWIWTWEFLNSSVPDLWYNQTKSKYSTTVSICYRIYWAHIAVCSVGTHFPLNYIKPWEMWHRTATSRYSGNVNTLCSVMTVDFSQNTYNRRPIVRPWGRDMEWTSPTGPHLNINRISKS